MDDNVRRGFGLLALGVAVFLLGLLGRAVDSMVIQALGVVGFWVGVVGLVLIARGLLRPDRQPVE